MNETTKEKKPKTGKKKGKKKIVLILVLVLAVLIVGGLFLMPKKAAVSGGSTVYSLAPVERRNITASVPMFRLPACMSPIWERRSAACWEGTTRTI